MAQLHTIAANMAATNDLRELRISLLQVTRAAASSDSKRHISFPQLPRPCAATHLDYWLRRCSERS
eukprot:4499621-Alexandrium_andersonii.AAC.1